MSQILSFFRKKKGLPLFGEKKYGQKISKKYKLSDILGRGGFSIVYHGENIATNEHYAVKSIEKKKLVGPDISNLENEISILKKINHAHIVNLIEVIDNHRFIYIVMELVTGGELFDRIVERGSYTEADASHLVKQILNAVGYLHERSIMHRDIKPENLLYYDKKENSKIMLTDFGLAKIEDNVVQKTACGTPGYVAPEVLLLKSYGRPVDCWSVGVVTYILLCGYPPFNDVDQQGYSQIIEANYEFDEPYWDDISDCGKLFVSGLMELNPQKRLTCSEALSHKWINGQFDGHKNIHQTVSTQLKKHFNAKAKWKQALNATTAIRRMKNI
ncbi:calcium/calmodulin-dependent protein kinase type 1D isoform X4 [Hydra vulgaris]|uniref:Calcium/calmodulin-dependent protein kinase type 1D isoform X4 n=1 Tax=Hydra vulgaris TaxID=6087 RepID=A0ABM4C664_HYDVU